MERYERYKDSGAEWIGEIPEGWEVVPIKYNLEVPITDGPHETPEFINDGVPFVSAEAIKNDRLDFRKKRGDISIEDHRRYSMKYHPRIGDVYMVKSGATTGNLARVETGIEFNIWSPLAALRPNPSYLTTGFLFFFMKSREFFSAVELGWNYGTQQNIGMNVLENLRMVRPPIEAQTAIANYLDRKTAEIDELIAQKERLIELYEEEKIAIINQAVTKGIDPDVRLKDSGVDWLGEIPEGWEVRKLKHVAAMQGGFAFSSNDFVPYGVQLIKIANLYNNELHLERQPTFLPNSFLETHFDWIVASGDILLSMTGTLGKRDYGFAILLEGDDERFLLNQRVSKILAGRDISTELLLYILRSEYFLNNLFSLPSGTKQGNLSNENVMNISIAFPKKLDEQSAIANFIKIETCRIEAKIEKTKKIIELQKEYRTALISEVVTGKIKVTEESTS